MLKNTPKQDRANVRTATGLERKYNLGSQSEKAETAKQSAERTSIGLTEFKSSAEEQIAGLTSKLKKYVQTWVHSGVPSLSNMPASEWLTEDKRAEHSGDFYYNTGTGKLYVFNNAADTYAWTPVTADKELYNITFYDSDSTVIATYLIKPGDSIKSPIENAIWNDTFSNMMIFPFTPTGDTDFYLWN